MWIRWHDNGPKESEGTFKDGDSTDVWTGWYDNGQKKVVKEYKDGKKDGVWIRWHDNGLKKFEGTYKDDELIESTRWDKNGVKITIPPDMVDVPRGTFQMGSNSGENDEKPLHKVTVSNYSISKTEVTFEQYDKFCDDTGRGKPDDEGWGRGNRPVINVSWQDAVDYCKWMSIQTGNSYRLPTEAEWEYAARSGSKRTGSKYSGSNQLDAVGWYKNNSGFKTHPVAQKKPNALGLYDMSGNVYEWCSDWYGAYSSSPKTDPKGPKSGSRHVIRGGSWDIVNYYCRVTNRLRNFPDDKHYYLGFRLVQE